MTNIHPPDTEVPSHIAITLACLGLEISHVRFPHLAQIKSSVAKRSNSRLAAELDGSELVL